MNIGTRGINVMSTYEDIEVMPWPYPEGVSSEVLTPHIHLHD